MRRQLICVRGLRRRANSFAARACHITTGAKLDRIVGLARDAMRCIDTGKAGVRVLFGFKALKHLSGKFDIVNAYNLANNFRDSQQAEKTTWLLLTPNAS